MFSREKHTETDDGGGGASGGWGARRFFLPEQRIDPDDLSGLPIWLIVSYSSSKGFVLFTLSCDDPLEMVPWL